MDKPSGEANNEPGNEPNNEARTRDRQTMTEVARRLRREATPAERRLWNVIRGKRCGGYRFLRQHDIGHFVLDFYCASARIALEIDGSIHDTPEVESYDQEREAVIQETFGIRFLRFTNKQILESSEEQLRALILQKLSTNQPL